MLLLISIICLFFEALLSHFVFILCLLVPISLKLKDIPYLYLFVIDNGIIKSHCFLCYLWIEFSNLFFLTEFIVNLLLFRDFELGVSGFYLLSLLIEINDLVLCVNSYDGLAVILEIFLDGIVISNWILVFL